MATTKVRKEAERRLDGLAESLFDTRFPNIGGLFIKHVIKIVSTPEIQKGISDLNSSVSQFSRKLHERAGLAPMLTYEQQLAIIEEARNNLGMIYK